MPVPEGDPKLLVARGYDRISEEYRTWATHRVRDAARPHYLAILLERLPSNASVLDLGCGSGTLGTEQLARRFAVTGVDISPMQIATARRNVPDARFICADMSDVHFPPASFDAVVAFYSLNHLPRQELSALLRSICPLAAPRGPLRSRAPEPRRSGLNRARLARRADVLQRLQC